MPSLPLLLALLSINGSGTSEYTRLKSDEHLIFFPTAAWQEGESDEWQLPIHGWIYEPETNSRSRRLALEPFRQALKLDEQAASSDVFLGRVRPFIADNERGKVVVIRLGDRLVRLDKSDANGHFQGRLRMPAAEAMRLAQHGRLEFAAVLPDGDRRAFSGRIHLIAREGRTVISDIDDTVKVTEVGDKRRVLENTLLRPFRPVPGMSDVYRQWTDDGATLEWVSSSPWQLYEPLAEFFAAERFPPAVWHLRAVRLADTTVLNLLTDPLESKFQVIGQIVERYPRRKFVLVGDSGERDPEAYGRIARQFPGRIERIVIRDVTNEPRDSPRYAQCWKELDPDLAQVFRDPAEIGARE